MPGNARRPGDILVTDDFGNDKPLALDVTVPSVQSSGVFSICARDATGLGATGLADAVKMKENVPECEMRGWECVPISIDIYGSFGVASDRFAVGASLLCLPASSHPSIGVDFVEGGRTAR